MSATDLRITTATLGKDAYVMAISGDLDVSCVDRLDDELERAAPPPGARLAVDLTGVPFIDSSVLGWLIETAKRLRTGGGDLVIVSDDPRILRTFEITGLDRSFTIERTLFEAIDRLVTERQVA
jgi:anti-sigma B factor antagonist